MIPLAEAQAYVMDRVVPMTPRRVAIGAAQGLVTAEAVSSAEHVPPFANTAMDGFAIRAADVAEAPVTLDVVGTIAAGADLDLEVGPGQAARIMTGAPMPAGADAVVMVELTELAADEASVVITESVPVGNHIRNAGEDLAPGDAVFAEGEVLSPGHLGVLASLGIYDVLVGPRPRVGVVSTGDELIDGPQALERGQIRDSNRHTLLALVEEMGAEPVDLGIAVDTEADIERAFREAVGSCDAVLSSGGVSMGDFDYVKLVLDRIGEMRWMQVAIKPAKPLAFGTVDATPIFGLPGNPVSSMVSFELFARPALRRMMGHVAPHRALLRGIATAALRRFPDGKTHFARVAVDIVDGRYEVRSAGGQGSHQLTAMARASALAVLPDGEGADEGEPVDFLLLQRW